MDTGTTLQISRILLTGPPGIGKTSVCKKLASALEQKTHKFDGFYTEEVRNEAGNRIGFDVVPLKNVQERSKLALIGSVTDRSQCPKYKVGNYHVFPDSFETAALPILESNANILIIDEIGKMELFSEKFYNKIEELFFGSSSEKHFIIATIPEIHRVSRYLSLFQKFHADKRSKIIIVNRKNRDDLPKEILRLIS